MNHLSFKETPNSGTIKEPRALRFNQSPDKFCLPESIKRQILHIYLFADMKVSLMRDSNLQNEDFIYSLYRGLKPRIYCKDNESDFILAEEN